MKWLMMCGVIVVAGVCGANVLTDPGFEDTGDSAWSPYTSTNAIQYSFDETSDAYSGSQSLSVYWGSMTNYQVYDSKQYFAVTAGETLNASVYAAVPVALNNMEAYLEIFYKDINGTDIGSLQSAHIGSVTCDWTQLTASGIIPDNTVTAMYRIVIFGGDQSTGGQVLFDDAFLQIPEPATGVLIASATGLLACLRRRMMRRG